LRLLFLPLFFSLPISSSPLWTAHCLPSELWLHNWLLALVKEQWKPPLLFYFLQPHRLWGRRAALVCSIKMQCYLFHLRAHFLGCRV
jgi:hypothetical protein